MINDNKYYNYSALDNLEKTIDEETLKTNFYKLNICCYMVDNQNKVPFIKYLLIKLPLFEVLSFPQIDISSYDFDIDRDKLIEFIKYYIYNILHLKQNSEFIKMCVYKGYKAYNNSIYTFFDLTHCNIESNVYLENDIWFGLIDEIVNIKHICNYPIFNQVTDFFTDNSNFLFLMDETNDEYLIPMVAYVGKSERKLNFTSIFGQCKDESCKSILGPYYYFTDFKNAVRQGGWSKTGKQEVIHGILQTDNEYGRYIKGGVIRLALFLGKTKIIQNMPDDKIDKSNIKKEMLEYENDDAKTYEKLTMRISDYDGEWIKDYDSVYLGRIELDDGSYLKDAPIVVIKDFDQQLPLTSHYINKSYLKEEFDYKNEYFIV